MPEWKGFFWRFLPFGLALLILAFHATINFRQATDQPSPGWSRTLPVGSIEYEGATVPALLESGAAIILNTTQSGITYHLISADGTAGASGDLALDRGSYNGLSAIGGKQVDLFFSSEASGRGTVAFTTVGPDAKVQFRPATIATGALGYGARQVRDGVAVFVFTKDGLSLYRRSGQGYVATGTPHKAPGQMASFDVQVLADDSFLAVADMDQGEGHHVLYAMRGTLADGVREGAAVGQFTYKGTGMTSYIVRPVVFGVDTTHAYLFTTVDQSSRGDRESTVTLYTAPLADWKSTWQPKVMGAAGPVSDQVMGGRLENPHTVPGQNASLQVLFQAQTASRFTRNLGLVMGTLKDGKLQSVELVSHGKGTLRPAVARGPLGLLVTFASVTGGSDQGINAVSSAPAFVRGRQSLTGDDMSRVAMDSLLDIFAIFNPVLSAGIWWTPMVLIIGTLYVFALNWMERDTRRAFFLAVGISVPLQIYTAFTSLSGEAYTQAMPEWMAVPWVIAVIYLGVSALMTGYVLKTRPPTKYANVLAPVGYWSVSTIILTGLFFGPFMRKG